MPQYRASSYSSSARHGMDTWKTPKWNPPTRGWSQFSPDLTCLSCTCSTSTPDQRMEPCWTVQDLRILSWWLSTFIEQPQRSRHGTPLAKAAHTLSQTLTSPDRNGTTAETFQISNRRRSACLHVLILMPSHRKPPLSLVLPRTIRARQSARPTVLVTGHLHAAYTHSPNKPSRQGGYVQCSSA